MIKGFNGLRGIAVLMVVSNHFNLVNYSFSNIDLTSIYSGSTGVCIFFCLSGFLITHILLKEFVNTQKINVRKFLIRRALRLLPVMLTYLLVLVLLMCFGYIDYNWFSIFYALTYTTNFSLRKHFSPFLYHFWSLSVEEHFYLFYPLLFRLKTKKGILVLLFFLVAISMVVQILQVNYILYVKQLTENYRWTLPAILPILTGAIISIILSYETIKEKVENNIVLLLILGLALFVNEILLKNNYMNKLGLNYLFQSMGIAFVLTYVFINQKSILVKFLELEPLNFIGRISYGLYVWHVLFSEFVVMGKLNLLVGIALSFGVAILSYYTIERYFINKKMQYNYSR